MNDEHAKSKFTKKNIITTLVILAVVLFAGLKFFGGSNNSKHETVVTEIGDLVQEVSVTGKLKAAQLVDLSFEKSGRVTSINVEVGENVSRQKALVSLSNADLVANLAEARSLLRVEQAKLDEINIGSRPEDLAVSEAKVQSAEVALADANRSLSQKISDLYIKSDDAVRTQADQFFTSSFSENPRLAFSTYSQLRGIVEQSRFHMEEVLNEWNELISNEDDPKILGNLSLEYAEEIKVFLGNLALALSSADTYSSVSQTSIDAWNTDISSSRTSISTATVNLGTSIGALESAEANLSLAKRELELKEAGSTLEQVRAQEATVERMEASVAVAKAELSKTIINAPFKGTVTRIDIKLGETIASNVPVISLISPEYFEIETYVPEADIAKVKINDTAMVTLDAYDEYTLFVAKVLSIDPAETILDGVSTYKVTLEFIDEEGKGKSGMTANIDILTDDRESVVAIPARALQGDNGDRFVRVLKDDGSIEEREVETGMRGSDGRIEIVSGLNEGESVVVFFEE